MFCKKCGSELHPNAKFCTHCGAPVEASTSRNAAFGSQQNDKQQGHFSQQNKPTSKNRCKKCGALILFSKNPEGLCDKCLIESLRNEVNYLNGYVSRQLAELGLNDYKTVKDETDALLKRQNSINAEIASLNQTITKLRADISDYEAKCSSAEKKCNTAKNKLDKSAELYRSVSYAIDNFMNLPLSFADCKLPESVESECNELSPTVTLKLHSFDSKELRKTFRDNEKQIQSLLERYDSRYTTKANKAIYQLMVIALKAELQNILINLKYEKLDVAIEQVKDMTAKYLSIACDGNQSIAGTVTKFIGEIEYLFINAVKIEYNYYIKREQARQEQLAIKEQMRQEAEERKALELERKRVELEESKYTAEIKKLKEQITSAQSEESAALKARIAELEAQLSDVIVKKDDIIKLQNGKAGYVYIISNLGSFGDDVFKIGMTRRINPQERIDELGSASVPFKFDVHSMIFSDDAVGLETELHKRLHTQRVNKVNLRKEFFKTNIDELEELVESIDPTADFSKTMLATEFRQSLSANDTLPSSASEENTELWGDDEEENLIFQ